jgi:anti-sigma factor RsiW
MSDHETFRGQLAALAAGALSPAETRAVKEHVAACPVCERELENWQRLARGVERLPAPPLEPATVARIAAAAQAHRSEFVERRWNRLVLVGLVFYGWALFVVVWPVLPWVVERVSEQLAVPWVLLVIVGLGFWWSFCWVIGLALLPLLRSQRIDLEEKVL